MSAGDSMWCHRCLAEPSHLTLTPEGYLCDGCLTPLDALHLGLEPLDALPLPPWEVGE